MVNNIDFYNIIVPQLDYERWQHLPVEYIPADMAAGEQKMLIREGSLYHFGVLGSSMFMAWLRFIAGRSHSSDCYIQAYAIRSFPWPICHTQAQITAIEEKAQQILDIRLQYSDKPLIELYHPASMPLALQKAHRSLDRMVEKAYGAPQFDSDEGRVEFLLKLDERIASFLLPEENDAIMSPRYENPVDMGMHAIG